MERVFPKYEQPWDVDGAGSGRPTIRVILLLPKERIGHYSGSCVRSYQETCHSNKAVLRHGAHLMLALTSWAAQGTGVFGGGVGRVHRNLRSIST